MNAGVVKSRYKKSELDKAIKQYKETALPAISSHEGARSAFLLLNRETGAALSIAIYETDASAKAFAPKAEKLIASFEPFVDSAVQPKRELYEIAASYQNEARAIVERRVHPDLRRRSRAGEEGAHGLRPGAADDAARHGSRAAAAGDKDRPLAEFDGVGPGSRGAPAPVVRPWPSEKPCSCTVDRVWKLKS